MNISFPAVGERDSRHSNTPNGPGNRRLRKVAHYVGFLLSLILLGVSLFFAASRLNVFWFTLILVITGFLLAYIFSGQQLGIALRELITEQKRHPLTNVIATESQELINKLAPIGEKYGFTVGEIQPLADGNVLVETTNRSWIAELITSESGWESWQTAENLFDPDTGECETNTLGEYLMGDLGSIATDFDTWMGQHLKPVTGAS